MPRKQHLDGRRMELLGKLCNSFSASGNESAVRDIIKKAITPYVDSVEVDKFGNLIAHKKGKGEKAVLAAHMDEIGLMVKEVSEEGKMYVSGIGGIQSLTLVGQNAYIFGKDG